MCGVLGIAIKNFNEKDCDLVRNLFRQSMIRGKHATGVSYVKNNTVHTFKDIHMNYKCYLFKIKI